MTLLAQAERLKDLTENVEAAADAERAARALDAVRRQVMAARGAVAGYGVVPDHAKEVPEELLRTVHDCARALTEVLAPLEGAEHPVLVAYGANQDAAVTGVLGSIGQRARSLSNALQEAQHHVVAAWAERAWPGTDLPRLEALAAVEPRAQKVLELRTELLSMDGERRLSATVLQRLALRVADVEGAATDLRDKAPPSAVIAFYDRLDQSPDGVPLSQVDSFVLQWLVEHSAGNLRLMRNDQA